MLFPEEEVAVLSPRLRWMNKHNIRTRKSGSEWEAWIGNYEEAQTDLSYKASKRFAVGTSEDDCLHTLALNNGWPLWNEEEFAKRERRQG